MKFQIVTPDHNGIKDGMDSIYQVKEYISIVYAHSFKIMLFEDGSWLPIFINKKWNIIPYSFQPHQIQQLYITGKDKDLKWNTYLKYIKKKVLFYQLHGTQSSLTSEYKVDHNIKLFKQNYQLDISKDIHLNKHHQRLFNKFRQLEVAHRVITHSSSKEILEDIYQLQKDKDLLAQDIAPLLRLAQSKPETFKIKSYSFEVNQLKEASVMICIYQNIAYFNFVFTPSMIKGVNVVFFVNLFEILKTEGVKTIDFEGSSIPGVARFYKGFGAHLFHYPVFSRSIR